MIVYIEELDGSIPMRNLNKESTKALYWHSQRNGVKMEEK